METGFKKIAIEILISCYVYHRYTVYMWKFIGYITARYDSKYECQLISKSLRMNISEFVKHGIL